MSPDAELSGGELLVAPSQVLTVPVVIP